LLGSHRKIFDDPVLGSAAISAASAPFRRDGANFLDFVVARR
jgi:hypothetical protein